MGSLHLNTRSRIFVFCLVFFLIHRGHFGRSGINRKWAYLEEGKIGIYPYQSDTLFLRGRGVWQGFGHICAFGERVGQGHRDGIIEASFSRLEKSHSLDVRVRCISAL